MKLMASKKKRNKKYHGSNAVTSRPAITKVSAVRRHPAHQWWVDHQKLAKPVAIAAGVGVVVIILIIGLVDLIW